MMNRSPLNVIFFSAASITFVSLFLVGVFEDNSQAPATTLAIVQLPENSNISCEESISRVKADLSKKGFFVPLLGHKPEVHLDKAFIRDSFYDYPTNRTETVIFSLGEVDNLYSSPQYMATISSQIMAACSQVGLVEFSSLWEGAEVVGYFPDRTARVFTNFLVACGTDEEQAKPFIRTVNTQGDERTYWQWGYSCLFE